MEENLQEQTNSRPWLYKKGQSGNPAGRKPGVFSLKEYVQKKLRAMSDEEREEYLEGIDKKAIWEMAEGKAKQDTDIMSGGQPLQVIVPPQVAEAFNINATNTKTSGSNTEQE